MNDTKDVENGPQLSEKEQMATILKTASEFLAAKMQAAAVRGNPTEKKNIETRMRLNSARLQHKLAKFVLDRYMPLYRTTDYKAEHEVRYMLKARLGEFWNNYHRLVLEPLTKSGHSFDQLKKKGVGLKYVTDLKQGVLGTVATALMAKQAGWSIELPYTEEDVFHQKDLILTRGDTVVPVQIKCRQSERFSVSWDDQLNMTRVIIPTNPLFYLDSDVGVPHFSKVETFGFEMNKLISSRSGKK